MAIKPVNPREKLKRLADLYIEDLLQTSEKELLDDAKFDPSLQCAGKMAKEAYQQAQRSAGRLRMEAARHAARHRSVDGPSSHAIDIETARGLLKKVSANDLSLRGKITLAARNLEDLSDAEIISIVIDLRELGIFPEDPDQ